MMLFSKVFARLARYAVGLFSEGKAHTLQDVQELMSGNICRCGAYSNINDAIMEVKSIRNYE